MPSTTQLQKYLKVDSVKNGDVVNFMDAGVIYDKDFPQKDGTKKVQTILEMTVMVNGEKKTYSPNRTTIKLLNEAWGTDTEKWVNKQGVVAIIDQISFGELQPILVVKPLNRQELGLPEEVG